jgi:phosphate transport system protein
MDDHAKPITPLTSRIRLGRKIEALDKQILELGARVEQRVRLAIQALTTRDSKMAARVIEGDLEIDRAEVDLEEECLETLALHQPVADDLRYIVSVLKINANLERIGDLAVNIAKTAQFVSSFQRLEIPFDLVSLAEKSEEMLRLSLDAFVHSDVRLAAEICASDDEVDRRKHVIHGQFQMAAGSWDGEINVLVQLFLVSRHLERIGDHATNIAEDVIYMVTGQIHRHRFRSHGREGS